MTYYYHTTRHEVRDLDSALIAAWIAAGNPKAADWTAIPDPPPHAIRWDGAQWIVPTLAESKTQRIAQINAEAMHRIESHWPGWAQRNVALGVYSEPQAAACRDWIASHIEASNIASDAVNAAATVDAVAAVVVTWP